MMISSWRKLLYGTVFVLAILVLAGCSSGTDKGWEKLDQEQMMLELENKEAIIVDLREPELYQKGHIPGAINIPFADFQQQYTQLSKNKRIVFVCHTGPMGEASSQFLQGKGYDDLANLTGGMAQWKGPVTSDGEK